MCWRSRSPRTSHWYAPHAVTGTATSSSTAPRATSIPWPRWPHGVTVAEVEELVDGTLPPDEVHLPGVFVQRVLPLTPEQAADKSVEKVTVR